MNKQETDKRIKTKCPLCGAEVSPQSKACAGCPLHRDCSMLCCENCGYKILDESRLNRRAKLNIFRRKDKKEQSDEKT